MFLFTSDNSRPLSAFPVLSSTLPPKEFLISPRYPPKSLKQLNFGLQSPLKLQLQIFLELKYQICRLSQIVLMHWRSQEGLYIAFLTCEPRNCRIYRRGRPQNVQPQTWRGWPQKVWFETKIQRKSQTKTNLCEANLQVLTLSSRSRILIPL